MHRFRTHTCGALRPSDVGSTVRLSGWVHRVRDHGHLVFVDLRDHYGITQCVAESGEPLFDAVTAFKPETVVTVTGPVVTRDEETVNPKIPTGEVEVRIAELQVQNAAETLPLPVHGESDYGEEVRLRYRFLDLRRERMHRNMERRSAIVASIRRHMVELGFMECHTPILTASSPEGARDFLVPSRLHPGTFYALPQAPQQFKQLVMASGFDRYFQIAPCFRDEDARADRSPGEFYQLDIEMAFVEQEDVFDALEPVMHGVFTEFTERSVTQPPFPRFRLQGRDAALRHRQAGPAHPHRDRRSYRAVRARGGHLQGLQGHDRQGGRRARHSGQGDRGSAPQLLRQDDRLRPKPRRARSRLHHLCRGCGQGADRQVRAGGGTGGDSHDRRPGGRRCGLPELRQAGRPPRVTPARCAWSSASGST